MPETAHLKVYQLKSTILQSQIEEKILQQDGYVPMLIKSLIQDRNGARLIGYYQECHNLPEWVSFISPYIEGAVPFKNAKKFNLILLIELEKPEGGRVVFAVTGGSGAIHLSNFIDSNFGIALLERIFDPDENKLNSVKEKAIIGDVLASSRYYRRSRALAYEDDFGKCFQNISVRLTKKQVDESFPTIAKIKKNKESYSVAVNCSSSLDLCIKMNLLDLILTIKEIMQILSSPPKLIFNKTLQPLDKRLSKDQISILNRILLSTIIDFSSGKTAELDIDFCPRDFEDYFTSSRVVFSLPEITPEIGRRDNFRMIEMEEFLYADIKVPIVEMFSRLSESKEYKEAEDKVSLTLNYFTSIRVTTYDADGKITTSGRLLEYCNSEIRADGLSYFILDNVWYELKTQFDETLSLKYEEKVAKNVMEYAFISKWETGTEDFYNSKYDKKVNPFELHKVMVKNIEICDALYVEHSSKSIFILHAKDTIGASIRDLVSQAFLSARIIEEEVRSEDKPELRSLYAGGVRDGRIDNHVVTEDAFLSYFNFKRVYGLLIHTGTANSQLKTGAFRSRIAKFSLTEFATVMHANDFSFAFIEI